VCVSAQDTSATIGGTVLDPSGAAVAGAKITITNTDRNLVIREVTTETAGTYSAPLLPIGNYSLNVEAKGFKSQTRTGIVLNVNDNLKINIALEVGAVTETVEVKSQAVAVDLGTTANASTIEGTQVREFSLHPQLRATGGHDAGRHGERHRSTVYRQLVAGRYGGHPALFGERQPQFGQQLDSRRRR
jgi:uncharacterized surface anchored protein